LVNTDPAETASGPLPQFLKNGTVTYTQGVWHWHGCCGDLHGQIMTRRGRDAESGAFIDARPRSTDRRTSWRLAAPYQLSVPLRSLVCFRPRAGSRWTSSSLRALSPMCSSTRRASLERLGDVGRFTFGL